MYVPIMEILNPTQTLKSDNTFSGCVCQNFARSDYCSRFIIYFTVILLEIFWFSTLKNEDNIDESWLKKTCTSASAS